MMGPTVSIVPSQNDLADAMGTALANLDIGAVNVISWQTTFTDRPCFACGEHIPNSERPWLWSGHGGEGEPNILVMHRMCLLDWVVRLQADVINLIQQEQLIARHKAFLRANGYKSNNWGDAQ